MSKDHSKPSMHAKHGAAPAPKREAPVNTNVSGRVRHDERGNAVWEWAGGTGALEKATTTQRLKRLDNPTLAIVEDTPPSPDGVKKNPLGTVKGYSPYDSGVLGEKGAPARKKDLRKLSEWLKLKKQADRNKLTED